MKGIASLILALIIGYFAISSFYFVIGYVFWMTFEFTKLILALLIALPLYVIIRRKLLK